MNTTEHQVSPTNSVALARTITQAVRDGKHVTVNGDLVVSFHNQDGAQSWNNGTVSYNVAAKAKGKSRAVYVKIGHMLTVTIEDAPAETKPKAPKPEAKPRAPREYTDRHPLPATVKGETGYLSVRTVDGKFRYAVTMDERTATLFAPGASTERHAKRAEAAGIKVNAG